MKFYKKIMLVGILISMALSMTACGQKNEVVQNENQPVQEEKTEMKSPAYGKYEFYQLVEKPELIKEFTDMEADYEAYLQSSPMRVLFLDKDTNISEEVSVYSIKGQEDLTALYIHSKEGKVVGAKLDEFNGDLDISAYEYDTVLYNYDNLIEVQATEEGFKYDLVEETEESQEKLKEKFEGKELSKFQDYLGVYSPAQIFKMKDSNVELQVYPIVSKVGYTASFTLNIVTEDSMIKELYVDELYRPSKDPLLVLKSFR